RETPRRACSVPGSSMSIKERRVAAGRWWLLGLAGRLSRSDSVGRSWWLYIRCRNRRGKCRIILVQDGLRGRGLSQGLLHV
ncbi:unnamed protein product, partial [Ectocarpus sp. 12 AP-2014]